MSTKNVERVVEQFCARAEAPLGLLFKDMASNETVARNADQVFPAASSIKIYILAELFRKAYAGECSLDDRLPMTADVQSVGSGVLARLTPGLELTLRDYATLMMIISDNTATDVLFRFLGRDAIRKNVIDALGLTSTRCELSCNDLVDLCYGLNGRSFRQLIVDNGGSYPNYCGAEWARCEVPEHHESSPCDAAKMLELLYRGQWVSPEASAAMLTIMKYCQTNTRIPRLLPIDTVVAHKTGTMDKLMVDIGIVYTRKGDYILCLFYNGNLATQEAYDRNYLGRSGDNFLAELSAAVYSAYMED